MAERVAQPVWPSSLSLRHDSQAGRTGIYDSQVKLLHNLLVSSSHGLPSTGKLRSDCSNPFKAKQLALNSINKIIPPIQVGLFYWRNTRVWNSDHVSYFSAVQRKKRQNLTQEALKGRVSFLE